jgi:hypothetical protein
MLPTRCEAQFHVDWDLTPGVYSLAFITKVNHGVSISMERAMRKAGEDDEACDERAIEKMQLGCYTYPCTGNTEQMMLV